MTVEIPEGSPEDFFRRILAFYFECGKQSIRTMASTSRRLAELYPEAFKGREPVELTRNVLHYLLSRKRKSLPDHGLLTSFVLVNQHLGFQSQALKEDRGIGILEEW